jgi:hypothetical protein
MVNVRRRLFLFYAIHHPLATVRSSLDSSDITFMRRALERARQVDAAGDMPVGAVIVRVLGRNPAVACETTEDATGCR